MHINFVGFQFFDSPSTSSVLQAEVEGHGVGHPEPHARQQDLVQQQAVPLEHVGGPHDVAGHGVVEERGVEVLLEREVLEELQRRFLLRPPHRRRGIVGGQQRGAPRGGAAGVGAGGAPAAARVPPVGGVPFGIGAAGRARGEGAGGRGGAFDRHVAVVVKEVDALVRPQLRLGAGGGVDSDRVEDWRRGLHARLQIYRDPGDPRLRGFGGRGLWGHGQEMVGTDELAPAPAVAVLGPAAADEQARPQRHKQPVPDDGRVQPHHVHDVPRRYEVGPGDELRDCAELSEVVAHTGHPHVAGGHGGAAPSGPFAAGHTVV